MLFDKKNRIICLHCANVFIEEWQSKDVKRPAVASLENSLRLSPMLMLILDVWRSFVYQVNHAIDYSSYNFSRAPQGLTYVHMGMLERLPNSSLAAVW